MFYEHIRVKLYKILKNRIGSPSLNTLKTPEPEIVIIWHIFRPFAYVRALRRAAQITAKDGMSRTLLPFSYPDISRAFPHTVPFRICKNANLENHKNPLLRVGFQKVAVFKRHLLVQ